MLIKKHIKRACASIALNKFAYVNKWKNESAAADSM